MMNKSQFHELYYAAIQGKDIERQYELIYYAEKFPEFIPIIKEIEDSILSDAPHLNWENIHLRSISQPKITSWIIRYNSIIKRFSVLFSTLISIWPIISGVILIYTTMLWISGNMNSKLLFLLIYFILGSLAIISSANLWNTSASISMRESNRLALPKPIRYLALASLTGVMAFMLFSLVPKEITEIVLDNEYNLNREAVYISAKDGVVTEYYLDIPWQRNEYTSLSENNERIIPSLSAFRNTSQVHLNNCIPNAPSDSVLFGLAISVSDDKEDLDIHLLTDANQKNIPVAHIESNAIGKEPITKAVLKAIQNSSK